MPGNPAATKALFDAISEHDAHDEKKAAAALKKMRAALTAGASLEVADQNRRTAAFHAATCDDEEPLALLFAHGLPLDVVGASDSGGTLLHRAAAFGCIRVIKYLLAKGLRVDARDQHGKTPLDRARGWKHGKDAVPLLTKLTKEARKGKSDETESGADLDGTVVGAAWKTLSADLSGPLLDGIGKRRVETFLRSFFSGFTSRRTERFLAELAGQDEGSLLGVGVLLAKHATRATPTTRTGKPARNTFHVGDLLVESDHVVEGSLVVTGDLVVRGQLSNHEGTQIAVGGSLTVDALWTEGPCWVAHDLVAAHAVYGFYDDYSLAVGGTLETPILVEDDHGVVAGRIAAKQYVARGESVSPALRTKLAKHFPGLARK